MVYFLILKMDLILEDIDLQNIVKSSLVANNKTILVVIYNNENQISYIGIKLK